MLHLINNFLTVATTVVPCEFDILVSYTLINPYLGTIDDGIVYFRALDIVTLSRL